MFGVGAASQSKPAQKQFVCELEPVLHRVSSGRQEPFSGSHVLRQYRSGVGCHISGEFGAISSLFWSNFKLLARATFFEVQKAADVNNMTNLLPNVQCHCEFFEVLLCC